MIALQVVLTCVEIVLLAGVLVYFLRAIDSELVGVVDNLTKIAKGAKAVEDHCAIIGPGADQVNRILGDAAGGLTRACELAEGLSA
ncbi:MAG TPA: hypothetical protein VF244_04405 [Acidimicrobiales bacterium]